MFLGLVLIKLPIAAYMLWVPFRSDAALESLAAPQPDSSEEDEGGAKTPPGGAKTPPGDHRHRRPRRPGRGRGPRRGPHGGAFGGDGPAIPAPARVRIGRRRPARVAAHR